MNNLKITKCSFLDWEVLQAIAIKTFADAFEEKNSPGNFNSYINSTFNESQIKKELQNPESHFYFFYKHQELIGYLKLNEGNAQTEPQGNDALEIERIYLYKNHQGKGYGKYMMEFALKTALKMGKKKIWLGVWEENHGAIAFYEKLGFEKFGSHIYTLGNDDQLDWMMQLVISQP